MQSINSTVNELVDPCSPSHILQSYMNVKLGRGGMEYEEVEENVLEPVGLIVEPKIVALDEVDKSDKPDGRNFAEKCGGP